MSKQKQILFNDNKEIPKRIDKIMNSLIGVDLSKIKLNEKGMLEHFEISPLLENRNSLDKIMTEDKIPGLCVALINNFEVEWVKAFGVKNTESKEPVTIETIFQAASVSKSLVATVVLKLVEEELLDLDEPVNNKLKGWQIPSSEFTKEKDITPRHILTHSSGINSPDGGFGREEGSAPTLLQTLKGELPAKNHPVEVEFTPGSKQQYSNHGFLILEKLVEDVTGKKLNDLAQEFIFKPLGMKNSMFVYPSEAIEKKMVYSHRNDKIYRPRIGLSPNIFGCGGLLTTPHDLAKFAIGLMDAYNGKKNVILSQKIAQEMQKMQVELDPTKWFGSNGFGLGLFLFKNETNFFFEHSGGNNPGGASVMMANPLTGQGLVLMANSLKAHERLFNSIKYTLAEEYDWSV